MTNPILEGGRTGRRWRYLIVTVLGVTVLAGCGGGGSTAASSTPNATSSATNASTNTPGASATSRAPVPAIGRIKCVEMASALTTAQSAIPFAMAGGPENLQQSVDLLNSFITLLPAEITDDMKTVNAGYANVLTALKESGGSGASDVQKASGALDTDAFRTAYARVQTWFSKQCN